MTDEKPITSFLCHKLDKKKAVQVVKMLANEIEDPRTKREVASLPVIPTAGVQKNHLIACSGNARIFVVNIKTGQSWEWQEWM